MAEYRKYLEDQKKVALTAQLKALRQPCSGSKAELVDRLLAFKQAQINKEFNLEELKELLRRERLPVTGNKPELVNRLLDTMIPKPEEASSERNCAGNSRPGPAVAVAAHSASASPAAVRPIVAVARHAARQDPVARVPTTAPSQPPVLSRQELACARAAAGCMTRHQYRTRLVAAGFQIEPDQDVFHIISSANGGADHPDNYHFAQNRNWNRAIGSRHDELNCYLAGPEKAAKAVAISQLIGNSAGKRYTGPSAAQLCRAGEAVMRDVRHQERNRKNSS